MENEFAPDTTARIPQQAPPVIRTVVSASVSGDIGVEVSDNDHNTDTEHDLFFVKMA